MIERLAASTTTTCPSCRAPMTAHAVAGHNGSQLMLDLCHACHGIWFDGNESLRMAPAGVVELFRHLHQHRDDPQQPVAQALGCPRCRRTLARGEDRVRAGRYVTWRCSQRHGRFATFSAFMIEKGFVRQLTPTEVQDLAARMRVIHCGSCGAAVDLRQDAVCPYCRSAFSLLDPDAVRQALDGYGERAGRPQTPAPPADVADALLALERERERAQRAAPQQRWGDGGVSAATVDDLWAAGIELVWRLLSR